MTKIKPLSVRKSLSYEEAEALRHEDAVADRHWQIWIKQEDGRWVDFYDERGPWTTQELIENEGPIYK